MEQNYEYCIFIRDGKNELTYGVNGVEAAYKAYRAAVDLMEALGALETGYVDLYIDNGGTLECIESTTFTDDDSSEGKDVDNDW